MSFNEEFSVLERGSKVRQESVKALYETRDCMKCDEYKEARDLWRKLALELMGKLERES